MTFRGALGAIGAGAGMGVGIVFTYITLPAHEPNLGALSAVMVVLMVSSLVGWLGGFLLGALLDGAKRLITG